MKNKRNDKTHLKPAFIKAYNDSGANVSSACESVGISRSCYQNWRNNDPEFRRALDDIDEAALDFVESKLMQLINANDPSSIQFYLKTKGMPRGYNEKYNLKLMSLKTERELTERISEEEEERRKEIHKKIEGKKRYYIKLLKELGLYRREKAVYLGDFVRMKLKEEQMSDELLVQSVDIPLESKNIRERIYLDLCERTSKLWAFIVGEEPPQTDSLDSLRNAVENGR